MSISIPPFIKFTVLYIILTVLPIYTVIPVNITKGRKKPFAEFLQTKGFVF